MHMMPWMAKRLDLKIFFLGVAVSLGGWDFTILKRLLNDESEVKKVPQPLESYAGLRPCCSVIRVKSS